MSISDWSSDVCSSDHHRRPRPANDAGRKPQLMPQKKRSLRRPRHIELHVHMSVIVAFPGIDRAPEALEIALTRKRHRLLARHATQKSIGLFIGRARDLAGKSDKPLRPAGIDEIGRASLRERVC